jgi:hypothetical protein
MAFDNIGWIAGAWIRLDADNGELATPSKEGE